MTAIGSKAAPLSSSISTNRLELVHWIEHWIHHPLRGQLIDEPEIEVQARLPEFADTDL